MQVCSIDYLRLVCPNVTAAALCAETQERQAETLQILDQVLSISKFPSKYILEDLVNVWQGSR
jgi:hypothetical protein